MNETVQTSIALLIVALALAWQLRRAYRRRKAGACQCGSCPGEKHSALLRRKRPAHLR